MATAIYQEVRSRSKLSRSGMSESGRSNNFKGNSDLLRYGSTTTTSHHQLSPSSKLIFSHKKNRMIYSILAIQHKLESWKALLIRERNFAKSVFSFMFFPSFSTFIFFTASSFLSTNNHITAWHRRNLASMLLCNKPKIGENEHFSSSAWSRCFSIFFHLIPTLSALCPALPFPAV